MSNKSINVTLNLDADSDISSRSLIVKPISVKEKPKIDKFKQSSSENNITNANKGLKQKIVSKVKSWSGKDKYVVNKNVEVETDLAEFFDKLDIRNDSLEELSDSNLMKARDSLQNLKNERTMIADELKSFSSSSANEFKEKKYPVSPKSTPELSETMKPGTTGTKTTIWDPFDKQSRKNRKDYKRKKKNSSNSDDPKNEDTSMPLEGSTLKQDLKTEDEKVKTEGVDQNNIVEEEFPYQYKYFPKNSKSVVFTNEVFVVYFNGQDVICESKEPLKKDIEQQIRNKEMRQGHLIRTEDKYKLCLF